MSAMVMLEVAHINVLTKCDLVPNWRESGLLDRFTDLDLESLLSELPEGTPKRYKLLTSCIASMLEDWNMVTYVPLDPSDDSIETLLMQIDHAIQYGEEAEVKARDNFEDDSHVDSAVHDVIGED
eukprot:c25900_g1_i1.p1 GENE.c25900_g1_i1~~c25900_g1_i1.p1  ORF type:complete len:125 (+),score=50.88 c25900_g1_i1:175-549(+)